MLKIGVLGLGNIAQKAYLPTYVQYQNRATFYFATRNDEVLQHLKAKYQLQHTYHTLDELIDQKIDACFIHTATNSHYELIKQCLLNGIHVYVDKPVSEKQEQVEELFQLAKEKQCHLQVGFNRRKAPFVQKLKAIPEKRILHLSKNRLAHSREVGFEIFDLFLHLVDTAVYLLDEPIEQMSSHIQTLPDGLLSFASMTLHTQNSLAHLTMDMYSGSNQEKYSLTSKQGTYQVNNLVEWIEEVNQQKTYQTFNDWDTTLYKRGFESVVSDFLDTLEQAKPIDIDNYQLAILSHRLCTDMLRQYNQEKK